jgi:hypothetical protein
MMSSASRTNSTNSAAISANFGSCQQLLARDAVHFLRAGVDVALGIQVAMKNPARDAAIHEFDAADLDDAVLQLDFEARGFRIENDLAHVCLLSREQPVDREIRERIDEFVAVMARVPLDPMPFDILRRERRIEPLP